MNTPEEIAAANAEALEAIPGEERTHVGYLSAYAKARKHYVNGYLAHLVKSREREEKQAEIATLRNALKECVGVMEDMPHNELCEILQWWTSVNPPRWGDCTCGRDAALARAKSIGIQPEQ